MKITQHFSNPCKELTCEKSLQQYCQSHDVSISNFGLINNEILRKYFVKIKYSDPHEVYVQNIRLGKALH